MLDIVWRQLRLLKARLDRLYREGLGVLPACDALFLDCNCKLTVTDDARSRVVEYIVESENIHLTASLISMKHLPSMTD
jgi:hypothetical protein